jgi:hypothetical protein
MQETAGIALKVPESIKFVAENFDGQVSLKSDHSLHYCKCFIKNASVLHNTIKLFSFTNFHHT